VLEAVGWLCQRSEGGDFVAVLRRYAPTWLLHFPSLVDPKEWDALQQRGGAPQSQMLREMAEALEAVSAEQLVILVLEDLHVSDPSTVELLAYLAQRRAQARLLIIGSYRPVDVILSEHPLRARVHELLARGYGQTIALELLTEVEVAAYLHQRLATAALPPTLTHWVFQRTDGNALFVVRMVECLLEQQRLTFEEGCWRLSSDLTTNVIPETLQHLILAHFHNLLPEQQRLLEAASVAGAVYGGECRGRAATSPRGGSEEICEQLVQRGQFLKELGLATWPDGTVNSQYGFRHALYPEVLYQQLSAGRRMRMHLAIGVREEVGVGRAERRQQS
jgi:predicted ATPase